MPRPDWLPDRYGYMRVPEIEGWCYCSLQPNDGAGEINWAFTERRPHEGRGEIATDECWCDEPECVAKAKAAICGEGD